MYTKYLLHVFPKNFLGSLDVGHVWYLYLSCMGQDNVVGIATRYRLDGLGIESRWGGRDFPYLVQTSPGAHPVSYTMGTWSFPGLKQLGRGIHTTTDEMGWDKMDPASQQFPRSHGYGSAAVLGRKTNGSHATATIFALLHTWLLWALTWTKYEASGSMLCNTWRHQIQCYSQPAHCTNGGFPQMLPSMAKVLQQVVCVCVCVQRGCTSRMIDWKALHYKYLSFMAEFWQHYDTPM